MSAPVDVLAAKQAIEQMRGAADDYAGDNWPEMADSLTKWADALDPCRAAVAELIEAAASASVALNHYRATGRPDYYALTAASSLLRAALARVGGAK